MAEPGGSGEVAMARLPKPSGVCRLVFVAAGLVGGSVANVGCFAYTAAGDRIFASTGILPQIAPSDQIYAWGWALPLSGEAVGTRSGMTNVGAFLIRRSPSGSACIPRAAGSRSIES